MGTVLTQGSTSNLLAECSELQKLRNQIIHQGTTCEREQASWGLDVSAAVYKTIVFPALTALGLTVVEEGAIVERQF